MLFSLPVALFIAVVTAAATFTSATKSDHVAFVVTTNTQRTLHAISSSSKRGRLRRSIPTYYSSQSPLFQANFDNNDDVFLLSVDGTLASTNRSRSWMAICVALKVWPTLQSNMLDLGMDPDGFDWECNKNIEYDNDEEGQSSEWLLKKLSALSSITQQGNSLDAMLGCDAVLLARLLLEEQSLDGGRLNGRGGKYGGKFHPSSTSDDDEGAGEKSKVGSRPLTVGELYANWGELRDVAPMKYPFIEELSDGTLKRNDPLPKIRQYLKELFSVAHRGEMRSKILPSWQDLAYDILFDYNSQSNDDSISLRQNTMLLLGHDAQIPWALTTLSSLGCALDVESDLEFSVGGEIMAKNLCLNSNTESDGWNMKVIVTSSDKARKHIMQQQEKDGKKDGSSDDIKPSLLLVVPNPQKEETHSNMIEQIVNDFNSNSETEFNRNTFVIHSSLEVLKQCKLFLGDDAPILSQGLRKCILPHTNMAVTLFLPEWADNVHPSQQNDGEMDPWLNLVREEQVLELISARVIGAPMV